MTTKQIVLIVEDDPDALNVMTGIVRREGYTPIALTNAEDAIARFQDGFHPAMMIVDIRLPGKNGVELLKMINKQYQQNSATSTLPPSIAITAHHTPAIVAEALDAGFLHCLRKPIDLDEITQTIHQVIPTP